MKEKNMALLGFVSSAADYLKNQLGEETEDIKEIDVLDFETIKNELSSKLSSSFSSSENNSDDLISAGREAFNDFVNAKQPGLIDEFEEIFNVDFKEKNKEKEQNITNHLMQLLCAPEEDIKETLKEDVVKEEPEVIEEKNEEIKEIEPETVEEETVNKEPVELEETEEAIDDEIVEDDILEEESFDNQEERIDYGPEIDEYVKIIAQNVSKPEEEKITIKEGEEGMDDLFSEIVSHETEPEKIDISEEELKTLSSILSDFKKEEVIEEKYVSEVFVKTFEEPKEPKIGSLEEFVKSINDGLEDFSKDTEVEEIDVPDLIVDEPVEETKEEYVSFIQRIINEMKEKEALQKKIDDEQKTAKPFAEKTIEESAIEEEKTEEIVEETVEVGPIIKQVFVKEPEDEIFIFDTDTFNLASELEKEVVDINGEAEPVNDEDEQADYVGQLIDDLNNEDLPDKIEQTRIEEENRSNRIYEAIKGLYPYLTDSFIRGVYSIKESLASDYREGLDIVLLHRLKFAHVDGLRKFVEVVLQHDYMVNVDERKMIVDVFKEHINTDGRILTDIFEVANQARMLLGEYEGYRVIVDEEGF